MIADVDANIALLRDAKAQKLVRFNYYKTVMD